MGLLYGQLLPEDSPWTYPGFLRTVYQSKALPTILLPSLLSQTQTCSRSEGFPCLLLLAPFILHKSSSQQISCLSNLVVMSAPWRTQTFKTQPLRSILLPTIAAETLWLGGGALGSVGNLSFPVFPSLGLRGYSLVSPTSMLSPASCAPGMKVTPVTSSFEVRVLSVFG